MASALLIGAYCLAASTASAVDVAALKRRLADGVLRWGGDAEGGAPYQLRDPHDPDRVIGFEVELADALAAELSAVVGRPIRAEFVQFEWDTLGLGLLDSRDFDVIISGLEVTPDRRATMRLSRPYYVYAQQLVARADDPRVQSLADCGGLSVGTMAETAAERLLRSRGDIDIVSFSGQVEPFLDLELGRLDAVLLDSPIALYYASPNPKLRSAGPPLAEGEYAIAMRPDDTALAEAIDEALGRLIVDGRLREIYRRWRLLTPEQIRLARGANRAAEQAGLGFDAIGALTTEAAAPPEDAVDLNLMAASARLWTFDQYAPELLKAAGMTLFLSAASMILAVALGLPVAIARMFGPAPVRFAALAYIELFRGIPLLLLLFVLYFGFANYGLHLPAVATAILGFGLNYAAYEAEVYRSAIQAVPRGQWEAARALGMRDRTVFRRVVLPQAARTALGPMTNDFVALFKDTSLVSVIAVRELTKEYLILSRSSMKFLEIGLLTAALYLLMSIPLGYLSRRLEEKFHG